MGSGPAPSRLWLALAIGAATALPLGAQPTGRIAATVEVLSRFPVFFHGRTVAIVASPAEADAIWRVPIAAPRHFLLVPASGIPPSRPSELRGLFFDVGRLSGERQLDAYPALQPMLQALFDGREPARETVFALIGATWVDPPDATTPSLRDIVLSPGAFDGRPVTVRGRFRGQNLFGDLPSWPRQSRWDFVLQSADASIWVTDTRPRGRGFDFDPTVRRNAGTWLEVSGTLRVAGGLPSIEGRTVARSEPEAEPAPAPVVARPPEPPPTVIFSAPVDGEIGVPRTNGVLVQFSRDMAPDSFADRVRITYGPGVDAMMPEFTTEYLAGNRGLDIRFATPLAYAAVVTVELLSGITARDGTPLAPAAIAFTVER
jgi:hypothetical protein